jgi:hypothetical protein
MERIKNSKPAVKSSKLKPGTNFKAVKKTKISPKIEQMPCQRVKYDKLKLKKEKMLKTLAVHKNLVAIIA